MAHSFEVGKANYEQLTNYAQSRLLTSEAILLGVNVEHNDLVSYASQQSVIGEGKGSGATQSQYRGGDARQQGPTSVAHVLIGGEGAPASDSKAVATQYVLAALIGSRESLSLL